MPAPVIPGRFAAPRNDSADLFNSLLVLADRFRLAREAQASELMHALERRLLLGPVLGHCDRCVGFLLFTTPKQRLGADAGSFI